MCCTDKVRFLENNDKHCNWKNTAGICRDKNFACSHVHLKRMAISIDTDVCLSSKWDVKSNCDVLLMSVYNQALLLKKLSGHKRGPGVCVNSKKKEKENVFYTLTHTHTPFIHTHTHSQVRSVLIPELNSQQVETRAKAIAATVWATVRVFMCVYVIPIPASCDLPYGQSSWLLPLKVKLKGSKH